MSKLIGAPRFCLHGVGRTCKPVDRFQSIPRYSARYPVVMYIDDLSLSGTGEVNAINSTVGINFSNYYLIVYQTLLLYCIHIITVSLCSVPTPLLGDNVKTYL